MNPMNGIRLAAAAATLGGSLVFAGTTRAQAPGIGQEPCGFPRAAHDPYKNLVAANNSFAFRLFDQLLQENNRRNVFISPTSADFALEMAYDGARGATQRDMNAALELKGERPQTVACQAQVLLEVLRSADPRVRLEIADSLWARAGIRFNSAFTQNAEKRFAAKLASLDFTSSTAPGVINAWVSSATHGKIKKIVDKIPPEVVMYLINSVYFDAIWSSPFSNAFTSPRAFTTTSDGRIQVPLMRQSHIYPYYQGQGFQLVSLPYGAGRFVMDVVLPRRGTGLQSFAHHLTTGNWRTWTSKMQGTEVSLALPRFTLTNEFSFKRTLTKLGMGRAFSRRADFRGICSERCSHMSDVLQKTYLKVYEKGTTATAVTVIPITGTAIGQYRAQMTVDHPFFVGIRDTKSGSVLFLGGINKPV